MLYLKVEVFVPLEDVEEMVRALNNAGLLQEGNYDYCYSYTAVKGHFRPLEGAYPSKGQMNEVNQVDEVKLEFRIRMSQRVVVERIVRQYHSYEVPVINFYQLL